MVTNGQNQMVEKDARSAKKTPNAPKRRQMRQKAPKSAKKTPNAPKKPLDFRSFSLVAWIFRPHNPSINAASTR